MEAAMEEKVTDERLTEKLENALTASRVFWLHGMREKSELFREDASIYRELAALRKNNERH